MTYPPPRRLGSGVAMLSLSSISAAFNAVVATRLLSYWHVLKWEADSEWEMPTGEWKIDGVKLVWAILVAYFAAGAAVSCMGIIGALKRSPSLVGFYRNYSVADLCTSAFATVLLAFATFRSGARAAMCEELALQPDLLRELDLNDIGINPENCELMFERGVVVFVGLVAILLVVRLQFILSITNFHKQVLRERMYGHDLTSDLSLNIPGTAPYTDVIPIDNVAPRRIYLLGSRTKTDPASLNASSSRAGNALGNAHKQSVMQNGLGDALVYAPVPIESLSAEEAEELASSGAWVASPQSTTFPDMQTPHRRHNRSQSRSSTSTYTTDRRHSRTQSATDAESYGTRSAEGTRHSRTRSSSFGKGGRIALPSHPNEGLLPSYETSVLYDVKS
ncbi:hypothetical protein SCHPADRAFT_935038 [Schizopora paradoxa]|uniref:Uncharacterized protein n=1 Tax=Schizopora paradoxa TaxID=27342 RepID=A0A0H2S7L3_9AGAM|nr:hypothetical protein SCHPADRAFT_935038 [Schizopora paradoxa]